MDTLTADFAHRQIASELASLKRDADRVAEDARLYAATVAAGRSAPGDANRLVQGAIQLAQQAARLAGVQETVAYLAPTADRPAT